MKKIFLIVLAVSLSIISCNNEKPANADASSDATAIDPALAPVISFEKENFDFGKINQGDKVTHEFKFTNTGKTPLIISDASATCGCTIPEYPKDPVAPGTQAIIKVVFNSAGKVGKQYKVVTITSNANPSTSEVYLTGEVNAPANNSSKN